MNAFEFPVGACLLGLVVVAAGWDLHARRIPNWLVLTGLVLALAVQWRLHGADGGSGRWALGMLTGGGLFVPLYLLRGMGAGDVKLMATVGAFVGPDIALQIALLTCTMGGAWALAVIVSRRAVKSTCTNILAILLAGINRHDNVNTQGKGAAFASVGSLPYGVAIAIGTLGVMFLQAGAGTR